MASLSKLWYVLSIAGLCASGCGNPQVRTGDSASGDQTGGQLTVFAAASLTDAFTELAAEFEKQHPNVHVRLSFAGSQSLRTQIQNGAPADVFASANRSHMDGLRDSRLVGDAADFVTNELVVVVPASNPARIESLADLPNAKRLVLADSNVPAGAYAERVLSGAARELGSDFKARVMARVVSREMHVRHTLQKVVLGEADAALVYSTDAAAAGDAVTVIGIPGEFNVRASYPIATVDRAPKPGLARRFVDFVSSETGQQTLERHGFRRVNPKTASR